MNGSIPLHRRTPWQVFALCMMLSIGMVLLDGCEKAPSVSVAPRAVVVAIARRAQAAPMQFSGRLVTRTQTPLSFRVPGQLTRRSVPAGAHVRRGEILATLDARDATAQAQAADSGLDSARRRMNIATAQHHRDHAQAKARLISVAQREQSDDTFAAAQAQLAQATQQWQTARNALSYQTLVAPADGIILATQADSGQSVSAGQPIYTLAVDGPRDLLADVTETDIVHLQRGAAASVRLSAFPGQLWPATVREIAPAAAASFPTWEVRFGLLANVAQALPGMSGTVQLDAGTVSPPDAGGVVVPATALFHHEKSAAVWIVDATNTVTLRDVSVGAYTADTILISEGLRAGERVVGSGVHAVTEGEKVLPLAPLSANVATSGLALPGAPL